MHCVVLIRYSEVVSFGFLFDACYLGWFVCTFF